jgi:uncharacterized protein
MKNIFLLAIFAFLAAGNGFSQSNYNVVFDLTSKDTNSHKTVIRWLNGIVQSSPDAKLEVVLYSQSLDMALKNRSVVGSEITRLADNKNIQFRVCAITLKRNNIDPSQLLPGVETVPDGIYEIISKQREGWGYIKVSH